MMNGIQKAFAQLTHALRSEPEQKKSADTAYDADLSRSWHHDHWQNLLACPMDARRYILEDWSEFAESLPDADDEMRIDSFSGRRVRQFN